MDFLKKSSALTEKPPHAIIHLSESKFLLKKGNKITMIKETVLLFNFQDRTQLRKLEMLLLPMKIRLKKVAKEDYLKPLGSFVNSPDVTFSDTCYDGEELPAPMIVFVNLPGSRLDTILAGMRRNKIGPIPHKAILTQTNQHWNVLQCFKEIDAEHKAMTESSSLS